MAVKLHGPAQTAGAVGTSQITDGSIATADLAGSAVTGAKLATGYQKLLTFTGINGAGAVTLTGAAVGDRVLVAGITTPGNAAALFETVITVINQIQQASATDLSSSNYVATLIPASA